jgi:hypothetical protein
MTAMLAVGLGLTVAAHVSAQTKPAPITKTNMTTATATVVTIDHTKRMITLKDDKTGQEDTFSIGAEVKRFEEIKAGDRVRTSFYESVVLQVRKPGDPAPPPSSDTAVTRAKSDLPAATVAAQEKMTVTVKAIDAAVPSVTVTTPDGRTVTRKVEDKKNLTNVKVGDQIDITYTRALLLSIERVK